ncbi:MAG: EAL domain-containing protein [Solirubrobacteraceae bacterium]
MSADVPIAGAGENATAPRFCPELLDQARAAVRVLRLALPAASVVVVDPGLRVALVASDVLERHGYTTERLRGRALSEALPTVTADLVAGCRAALGGGDWHGSITARTDDSRFWVQASPLKGRRGDVVGAMLVAQDMTPSASERSQLERRIAQQEAVAQLGIRAAEGPALRDLQQAAAEFCRDAMGADLTSVIEIAAGEHPGAVLVAGTGWEDGAVGSVKMSLDPERLAGYVVRRGRPLLVEEMDRDARFAAPVLVERGMTSGISTPIGNPQAPVGILGAHSRLPQRFTPDDVAFMQALAGVLAAAADRDRAAEQVAQAEARFRSAFRHAPIGMALFDSSPVPGAPIFTQVNDALCAMLGYPADDPLAIDPVKLSHPDDLYIGVAEALGLAAGHTRTYSVEKRLLRSDGSVMHARIQASLVQGGGVVADYGICQIEDLSETKRLRDEEDRIWELSADLLAIIGPEGFVRVSPSWEQCLGFDAAELAALSFEELIHPEDQVLCSEAFERAVAFEGAETHFECRVRTRHGDWRWLAWSGRVGTREWPDDPLRVYCVARDVTERRETQRALMESLSLFDQSFENAPIGMAIVEPGTGRYLRVNEALCRLLGRGEHELLALESVTDLTHPDDLGTVLMVVEGDLPGGGTFQTEKRYLRPEGGYLWASLHVTPIRDADGTVTALFGQIVDIAAQKARQEELQRQLDEIGWVGRIRDALDHDRFELHGQPIVDLASQGAVQHELLIRMRDESGELVPPGAFLPAAEEHGLIQEIDRWVLGRAVQIAAAGRAVEVNVSAASMSTPEFLAAVERELDASGADPALLVFEITETALMRQMDSGVAFAERLAGLGCRFALDDFGTGYGSFTYLKRLPVHYLKIDREFVRELASSPRDRHVVQAIVSLADGFEAQTIAEGVEDAETLELLRGYGVDYAQGYHLGRPAPLQD